MVSCSLAGEYSSILTDQDAGLLLLFWENNHSLGGDPNRPPDEAITGNYT
jgi:hypothetical protein